MLIPLHSTGVGKAMLAHLPLIEVDKIITEQGLSPSTPNTIVNKDLLVQELVAVKQRGFATDNEEGETGIRCIAVPVFRSEQLVVGAISVSGPAGRLLHDMDLKIAGSIREGAAKLSAKLGYQKHVNASTGIDYEKEVA